MNSTLGTRTKRLSAIGSTSARARLLRTTIRPQQAAMKNATGTQTA